MTTAGGERLRRPDAPVHASLATGDARVIVVGDPHGCCAELEALLEKCAYSEARGDVVVLIGDLVNKGPSSAEVVRMAVDRGFCAVAGNHDFMALERWERWRSTGELEPPGEYGPWDYVTRLREQDVEWLRRLPLTLTLPDAGHIVLVHAGLVPGKPLGAQSVIDCVLTRNVVVAEASVEGPAQFAANHDIDAGEPWAKAWHDYVSGRAATEPGLPPLVVFGHDWPRGMQQYGHTLGIDTNCCDGGQLTACILPSRELVQVPGLGRMHKVGDGKVREWRPD